MTVQVIPISGQSASAKATGSGQSEPHVEESAVGPQTKKRKSESVAPVMQEAPAASSSSREPVGRSAVRAASAVPSSIHDASTVHIRHPEVPGIGYDIVLRRDFVVGALSNQCVCCSCG